MPAVGLGTFRARGQDVAAAVQAALHAGFRHIDTAQIYKNESDIAAGIAASGVPRQDLFLVSKISPYQQGTAKATAACEASLAALVGGSGVAHGNGNDVVEGKPQCSGGGVDGGGGSRNVDAGEGGSQAGRSGGATPVIDLMLVHWPGVAKTPADSPANAELRRETWRVLEEWHRRGAFRAIGVSNYEVRHLEELLSYAVVPPAVNQVECHPRFQQRALRAFCAERGIAVVAYSPYGAGALLDDPAVGAAAAVAGVSPAQALLLWGLHRGCAVIPKSVRPERLAEVAPARLAEVEGALGAARLAALLRALDALGEEGDVKYCWDASGIA